MNLLEVQIRAVLAAKAAESLTRCGFKTEGRKLKVQATEVAALVTKALEEMPPIGVLELYANYNAGKSASTAYKEKRRARGKYYAQIGKAEKTMLKTYRAALDSLYKSNDDWTRRQQIDATVRMYRAIMDTSRAHAKQLLAENY